MSIGVFFFPAEDRIRDVDLLLEFRRWPFRSRRQHAATEALRRHRRLTAPRTPQLSGVARVSEAHPGWMSNGPGCASLTRATPLPQDHIAPNPRHDASARPWRTILPDRTSTRLNSSH